jgi:hypothetical protein
MKLICLFIFAVLAMAQAVDAQTRYGRLPDGIALKTEVAREVRNRDGKLVSSGQTTVEKRLNELKARYKKGKLVDGAGREIRFFEPLCRGMSAGVEEDRKAQMEKDSELAALRKKYTVLVLLCSVSVS